MSHLINPKFLESVAQAIADQLDLDAITERVASMIHDRLDIDEIGDQVVTSLENHIDEDDLADRVVETFTSSRREYLIDSAIDRIDFDDVTESVVEKLVENADTDAIAEAVADKVLAMLIEPEPTRVAPIQPEHTVAPAPFQTEGEIAQAINADREAPPLDPDREAAQIAPGLTVCPVCGTVGAHHQ